VVGFNLAAVCGVQTTMSSQVANAELMCCQQSCQ